jgi:hypothetical protein
VPRKIDRPTVPYIAISGSPDGTAIYECRNDPSGLVHATPGSLYLQTSSNLPAALFLKTIGGDKHGWTQLAML